MNRFVIKSKYPPYDLAVINTDGRNIDFAMDNTEGKLPQLVGQSYQSLIEHVSASSFLTLEEDAGFSKQYYRYRLNSGDVIELSTDGTVGIFNGTLMDEVQKAQLMQALQSGQLAVSKKPGEAGAIPVLPMQFPKYTIKQPEDDRWQKFLHQTAIRESHAIIKEKERKEASSDKDYDYDLEEIQYENYDDGSNCMGLVKNLMYLLKYGCTKGESPLK